MNGLTDIFYDVVDSAVSKECKRLSSSLFSEDYLNELTTNQEKALFKLFRNIASLSVKFEKGVAEYSPGIILYGEGRTFDLSDIRPTASISTFAYNGLSSILTST